MKYLLDSDTLIRSKNDEYQFATHPGFWEWLEQSNNLGLIGSVQAIRHELTGEDQLSNWVKHHGNFFDKVDAATAKSITQVTKWLNDNAQFSDAGKQAFFASADLTLIAHAHAHGCTVVTHEKHRPEARHSIQIPTVCEAFAVPCMTIFKVISELKPKFVLGK
jgi:Domain of unknown function (DUF4411)